MWTVTLEVAIAIVFARIYHEPADALLRSAEHRG
jgi:hypothetical protein